MASIVDVIRLFAEPLDTAVVVTDCVLSGSGPTIQYVNQAFVRMSGYDSPELLGQSPRMLQGQHNSWKANYAVARKLRSEGRFRGVLQNYRKTGEQYLCELDIHRINANDGTPQVYIAFEREVVRRRGRPSNAGMTRYRSVAAADKMTNVSIDTFSFFVD